MKASIYNQFPEGFEDPAKKFDKPAIFELVNLRKDPEDKTGQKLFMPSIQSIKLTDKIIFKDGGESKIINIAYAISETPEGELILGRGKILFTMQNRGRVLLNPNNPEHVNQFRFMYLSSENENSPYRNPSVKPLYRLVDPAEEARKEMETENALAEVIVMASNMALPMAKNMFRTLIDQDPDKFGEFEIRSALQKKAKLDPAKFKKTSISMITKLESLLKEAKDKKVLRLDIAGKKFVWEGSEEVIFSYNSVSPSPYQQFAEYLLTEPDLEKKIELKIEIAQ